ncbi:MAG: thiamine pyrophosphate-dependent dehydrogenase E1 component subunit alpha [Actinobacteria bacterium]|nr:thiamine pyrophosphate-dependent dehydrogenase E1 component subunit alpha [Actinomycetota bacterium]
MLEGYRLMARIRLFETKVSMLFSEGKIPGFVHLYSGEEAIAVGVCMALEREDFITSTHRGHGHLIAKGGDVNRMMAELFSRKTGYCSGKGGSMHIADTKLGILGANGIVGAGIPIAVGAALASKLSKTGAVAVSFFGDGASNQGTFHESLNMASIWKLPVVFVCENNGYAISISKERSSAVSDLATRAVAYAMDGVVVNGANVFEVYAAASNAISKARSGGGPTLIEAKTYRFCQHNEGGEEYRCPSYLECCKIYDPLEITKNIISENYPSLVSELDQIFKTEQGRIEEALAFALKSPKTDTSDALKGIYSSYINDAAVRGKVKN